MAEEPPIILQTGTAASADAAVIWLHGLGADGNDFGPVVAALELPDTLTIRFIFPHAPQRPITINQGYRMRGWYDITSLDIANQDDESGIIESSQMLLRVSDQQQAQGIPAERIIFAGFSQGGAIALHAGLRSTQTLAGIIALSTYLPMQHRLVHEAAEANRQTPIFMAHGLHDDVVSTQFGARTRDLLQQQGYSVQWHEYAMGHSVCTEEISHISTWIASILDQE